MGPGIDRKKISHFKVFYVKSVCITNAFGRKNDAKSEIGDFRPFFEIEGDILCLAKKTI